MKNTKLIISILVITVIIIGAFFVFSPKQEEQKVVKISDRGLASALPIYVAIEKGYFEEFGLKPELVKLSSGNDVFNALTRNELDIGEIPIDPLIFAEDKANTGVKIFLVGKWSQNTNKNFDALFVVNDSSITSLKDLEGKKIGVFPGVTAKTFLAYYLKENRIDTSKVEFVQLAPNLHLQSLSSGAIDALWAYQPTVTVAENSGFIKIENEIYNNLGVNYFAVYSFSDSFSMSSSAKDAQKALSKAIQFMKSNEAESREILAKYTALGDLSSQMKYFPQYSEPTNEDKEELKDLIDFYKNEGLISNTFSNEKINLIFYNK